MLRENVSQRIEIDRLDAAVGRLADKNWVLKKKVKEQSERIQALEGQTKALESQSEAFSSFFKEQDVILTGLDMNIVDMEERLKDVENLLAQTSMTVTGHNLAMVDLQNWVMSLEMNEMCFRDDFREVHKLMNANRDRYKAGLDCMRRQFRDFNEWLSTSVDLIVDINDRLTGDVHCSHCPGYRASSPSNHPGPSCQPDADADLANKLKDELVLEDSSSEEGSEELETYVPGSPISIPSQPYVTRSSEDAELGLLVPINPEMSTVATTPEPVGAVLPLVREEIFGGKHRCPDLFVSGPCSKCRCCSSPDDYDVSSLGWHGCYQIPSESAPGHYSV